MTSWLLWWRKRTLKKGLYENQYVNDIKTIIWNWKSSATHMKKKRNRKRFVTTIEEALFCLGPKPMFPICCHLQKVPTVFFFLSIVKIEWASVFGKDVNKGVLSCWNFFFLSLFFGNILCLEKGCCRRDSNLKSFQIDSATTT